jgi:L-lactate dehydrogenase (cytochrome)
VETSPLTSPIDFLNEHPGGVDLILKCAGRDATESYDTVHNPELVGEMLPSESYLGQLKPNSLPKKVLPEAEILGETRITEPIHPPLSSIINVADFEKVAQHYLSDAGWAYYSSGAEDELSLDDARRIFNKIALRPRIMRNVEQVSTETKILGYPSSLPIYISPTGLGRYAHREAEKILATVAGNENLIYMMPTSPSHSHEAIFGARARPEQPLFFQLYSNRDRTKAEALIRKVQGLGASALFVTVDSPVLGRRERDDRVKVAAGEQATSAGVAKTSASGLLNPTLVWEDLKWLRGITSLPIVLKGVQTVEDAMLAHAHGAHGIVLSNHGGRSLDTAQSPILTLLEIRKYAPYLVSPSVKDKFQIFLDGGIKRGTDIIKALALGATAVGIGRPFLYSMTADYGEEGVKRLVQMLRSEVETNMALTGAVSIADIAPEMVNSERAETEVSRRVKL